MRWRDSQDGDDDDIDDEEGPPPSSSLDEDEPDSSSAMTAAETNNNNSSSSHNNTPEEKKDVDDEGTDHAEPPKVPWQPQNTLSLCEFTHVISDYAQKRESGCKKAEYSATTVDESGNRWRLIIYVNGNGRASNHHLSLFLQVADAEDLPFGWKKAVSYVLTLEHPQGGTLSYAKRNPDKTFKLCPKAIDWGWSQFITSDRIQQEGFVVDDSLTVRASVTVKSSSVSIDPEDAELYLKCAVEEGDAEAVRLCLEQGASVNCQFKDDLYTPLHTACSSGTSQGSIDVLNLLLEEGADANACNKWKETPLLIAANNGHYAACEALLKHGADPSLCSEAGWSALTFAAHKGFDEIVKLLLEKGAPVNTRVAEDNSTPLHKACAGSKPGHLAAVRLLLESDADIHALNKWRETPLLTAANHGQAGAVQLLLQKGADPCKCTDTGWSPLSIAAYKGHDDVVRLLLEEGAPTEEEDPTLSALLQAATKGLPDTVELLLKNGADHTVTTKKGDTALSILVEQNLIDAAVDMVTNYNASIPRCSRDRKKVQRARLLINLRMKQLERDGKKPGVQDETDDDETDENESGETRDVAQHHENGSTPATQSKKKKRKGNGGAMSAEEKARAAEEALLQELEQEDAQAKKEEAEANNKKAKKKKKKERERQLKLKEEQERREREELQAKERARLQKEKDEKLRREKEEKLREQRERDMKEALEREKALALKRKERERKEREQQKERDRATSLPSSPAGSEASDNRPKPTRPKKSGNAEVPKVPLEPLLAAKKSLDAAARPSAPLAGNRRWETTSKSPLRPTVSGPAAAPEQAPSVPRAAPSPPAVGNSQVLSPRPPTRVMTDSPGVFLARPVKPVISESGPPHTNGSAPRRDHARVEHPAVSLFRREKVQEMIQRCSMLPHFDEATVKRVILRWVMRAAHERAACVDPLIPSWHDFEKLSTHFQRQFIAESRRGRGFAPGVSIEALKEAGASVALTCQRLAKEVEDVQKGIAEHMPVDWTDETLGMSMAEDARMGIDARVIVSWANRSSVQIPFDTFASLRERHVGPAGRLLTSSFGSRVFYDAFRLLLQDTGLDRQLPVTTKSCLATHAAVSVEFFSSPFNAYGRNVFWGCFEEFDGLFGGRKPFGKDDLGVDNVLAQHGGSALVLPPPDNMLAARYMGRMLDLLEATDNSHVPMSFAIFLPADCFHDLPSGPTPSSLHSLDSRLADTKRPFVKVVEQLAGGQHAFVAGKSPGRVVLSTTNSLFVLLQNNGGHSRFPVSGSAVASILNTLSVSSISGLNENPLVAPIGFPSDFGIRGESPLSPQPAYFEGLGPLSPDPQLARQPDFGAIGATSFAKPFSPAHEPVTRASRHGRLFDLVDDGEDDHSHEVDLVSGMLNNLDVGLFQNANLGSDVDIEAISLMGIGGPPSHSARPRNQNQGRFG